jgi:hypothetical protein
MSAKTATAEYGQRVKVSRKSSCVFSTPRKRRRIIAAKAALAMGVSAAPMPPPPPPPNSPPPLAAAGPGSSPNGELALLPRTPPPSPPMATVAPSPPTASSSSSSRQPQDQKHLPVADVKQIFGQFPVDKHTNLLGSQFFAASMKKIKDNGCLSQADIASAYNLYCNGIDTEQTRAEWLLLQKSIIRNFLVGIAIYREELKGIEQWFNDHPLASTLSESPAIAYGVFGSFKTLIMCGMCKHQITSVSLAVGHDSLCTHCAGRRFSRCRVCQQTTVDKFANKCLYCCSNDIADAQTAELLLGDALLSS